MMISIEKAGKYYIGGAYYICPQCSMEKDESICFDDLSDDKYDYPVNFSLCRKCAIELYKELGNVLFGKQKGKVE